MDLKTKLAFYTFMGLAALTSVNALASDAASCTLNGNWHHKAAGSSQTCLSYVCCSNGMRTGWVAGAPKDAEDWCKGWRAKAVPADSCTENSHEVYNKMTLIKMAILTADRDEDDNEPPPPEIQCRYDRECDGE